MTVTSKRELGKQLAKKILPQGSKSSKPEKAPPPPIRERPPVEKVEVFYDNQKKIYYFTNSRNEWISATEASLSRYLRGKGHNDTFKDDYGLTDLERMMDTIMRHHDVDFAGQISGYPAGYYDVDGSRILCTKGPALVEPRRGPWTTVKKFLGELLGDEMKWLIGWLKNSTSSLYAGPPFKPGQALILAGPPGCGKSLLQSLLTEMLGGREAKPYRYMVGDTAFNGELVAAGHLTIADEPAHTDIRARRYFGHQLKNLVVNPSQSIHAKGRNAITLSPFWRLSISLNERPEDLLVLPPLDDETRDKMILLRCHPVEFPFKAEDLDGFKAFRSALSAELPAFVAALRAWKIPPAMQNQRFGVKHYLNPELLYEVDALSPEMRLLQIIDQLQLPAFDDGEWVGSADDLERLLRDKETHGEVSRLATFNTAIAQFLGRLKAKVPDRVEHIRGPQNTKLWKIKMLPR